MTCEFHNKSNNFFHPVYFFLLLIVKVMVVIIRYTRVYVYHLWLLQRSNGRKPKPIEEGRKINNSAESRKIYDVVQRQWLFSKRFRRVCMYVYITNGEKFAFSTRNILPNNYKKKNKILNFTFLVFTKQPAVFLIFERKVYSNKRKLFSLNF